LQITYIDFLMYELLDINSHLEPTILDDVPSLRAFHSRIEIHILCFCVRPMVHPLS